MNIKLHPDINNLDPGSLCYSIYTQLYHNFFNSQDSGTVIEGDSISIRLHNTAYSFADAIAGNVEGGGSSGGNGILLDYLKKSGGNMTGLLRANYGFEAGIGNNQILHIYNVENVSGVRITGELRLGGSDFYLGEKQVIRYDKVTDLITISGTKISTGEAIVSSQGKFIIGTDEANGISISSMGIWIKGNSIFHSGNANLDSVDWQMRNGDIFGNLEIAGTANFSGKLVAESGVSLGDNGISLLSINRNYIVVSGFLSFNMGYGIQIADVPVLIRSSEKEIQIGAVGGDLLLGSKHTNKTRLLAGIADVDGDNLLITKYGGAYFPDSLRVRHHYGNDLFSSYRVDASDEGMIIHRKLRFGSSNGSYLSGNEDCITFSSNVEHITTAPSSRKIVSYHTQIGYRASNSTFKPQNRFSDTLFIGTDADFFCFGKPIESKGHLGIEGTSTRLTDKTLFFTNEAYLLSSVDGIKHYGNASFLGNVSSEYFSSGFAGYGWAILKNRTTSNIAATFDELTIRKKMRVYELEVQKDIATNGSFWVSDSCSGDNVERIS